MEKGMSQTGLTIGRTKLDEFFIFIVCFVFLAFFLFHFHKRLFVKTLKLFFLLLQLLSWCHDNNRWYSHHFIGTKYEYIWIKISLDNSHYTTVQCTHCGLFISFSVLDSLNSIFAICFLLQNTWKQKRSVVRSWQYTWSFIGFMSRKHLFLIDLIWSMKRPRERKKQRQQWEMSTTPKVKKWSNMKTWCESHYVLHSPFWRRFIYLQHWHKCVLEINVCRQWHQWSSSHDSAVEIAFKIIRRKTREKRN